MTWFARDHTGRSLTDPEREFLAALVDLLSEVQPQQIEQDHTALDAERDESLIALMPHRALGGIAIVVWLAHSDASVSLAQVGGLDVSHDSLDAGVFVSNVKLDRSKPNFGPLLERIREQLFAPLTIRFYGANQATVWVKDGKDVLQHVGDLGTPVGWFRRSVQGTPTSEVQIRFVDSVPPPITEPSRVDDWFSNSGD